jgi:hypothetical protein
VIQEIVERERVNCEFARIGSFLFAPPHEKRDELSREYQGCRSRRARNRATRPVPTSQLVRCGRPAPSSLR